jgi:AraC-like DNA-binding protein
MGSESGREGGKRTVEDAPLLRGSRDFDTVADHRAFIDALVGRRKGSLTAARCAELASMSQQKLKRRLALHRTDISREIDVVQQEYARDALAETDRSIADIAASLGFSDSANFTRAFRRSNGLTPPSSGNRIKARTIRLLDPPWNRPFGLPDALSGRSAVRALTGDHFPHVQRRSPFAGCTAASKQGLLANRRARHCPACSKEPCRT